MNYLLIFYTGNEIKKATLRTGEYITAGAGENDTVKLSDSNIMSGHLIFRFADNGINLFSRTPFSIMGYKAVNRILSAGDTVNITDRVMLAVFENCCDTEILSVNKLNEISIGRSVKNDICLKGSLVSSRHAVIRKNKDSKWIIKDRQSRNGVFVDGKLITSGIAELHENAEIFIGGFIFEFANCTLKFKNTPGDVIFSENLVFANATGFTLKKPYPSFYRSPRIRRTAVTSEVEILSPPSTGSKPSVSWLSILLPPCLMITVMLLVSSFTRNVNTLFYTLPMSSVSIIMAVINYKSQNKKWLQIQELAAKKYHDHLHEKETEIAEAETEYMSLLSSVNPGILECVSIAKNMNRRLWERVVTDSDFLNIRLGIGEVLSNVNIKIPKEQLVIEENPFLKEAAKVKARHEILSGIPVCHSFLDSPITGLEGNRESVIKITWSILINIATHHSYEDVKIVCVYPENEKEQWEWLRWLPHVWNDERTKRFMSCTLEDNRQNKKGQDKSARAMLRELSETLKIRQRESSGDRRNNIPETPFYFLVFADKKLVESSGEQFLPESSTLGFAVLYAYGDIRTLPKECNAIIDCGDFEKGVKASVQMTFENETGKIFIPDGMNISLNIADKFARSLAPVRVHSSGRSGLLPSKALLFEGLGVRTVEELNILRRWKDSRSYTSLAVPIGLKGNGDMFYFDVHESAMGPHGVVAGTSGSGKSEMLTAWLLSLTLHFSPKDLNILLIEFKGNDLSNILSVLPHVAGVVNNLQGANVIERSLISLAAENERRQKIFASLTDLATKSLPAYQEYQKKHPEQDIEALPFLIVVLDEFAEFKKQFPEQVDKFVQIARVGRSTGLYMVLSTQSPSGIVPPQIESNVKFSICLRTANTGESKELIGTTDAFFISRPGRAYVKVGDSVYEQIQTFFSKVSYNPNRNEKELTSDINLVEIDGERINPQVYDRTVKASDDVKTEGQVLVSQIIEVTEKNGFSRAKPVWTELLPEFLTLTELDEKYEITRAFSDNTWKECNSGMKFAIGLSDIPQQQRQEPFILDFMATGHQILFGAPSSGKTTFLQTSVISAALSYTPEQLQFLIFDLGSGSMRTFEDLPHTLIVGHAKKTEKLEEAKDYLLNELDRRNSLLEAQRVSTFTAYNNKISGKKLPIIIVVIDNVTILNSQFSEIMDVIIKTANEGGGLGIYLLISCVGSSMFKLDNYIKSKHALELTDITEYRSLVGAASKQAPGHFKGRGFTQGPIEFQTAMCDENYLNEICIAMRNAWSGENASLEEAENRDIIADELNFDDEGFQIGVNKTSKQTVNFTFSDFSTCIISGTTEEFRNNVLNLIINAFVRETDTKIYVYEKEEKIDSLSLSCVTVHEISEADSLISELADEFDRRSNDIEETNYQRIIFCIKDFVDFYRGISQESADILEVITRSGADFNMCIYIISSIEDLAFLVTFRDSIKSFDHCLRKGNAIAVGGNIRDYSGFDEIQSEKDIAFADYEGCLIHNNKVTVLKFAKAGVN